MGSYFEKELAISGYTKDPAIVMKTIANRYIGHNPPFGASYYAYQKTGIRQDDNYRFVFNFHEIYPDSPLESNVYAWAKLWSDDDMAMSFEIRCFGPVIIYCNGERVFKPNIYYACLRRRIVPYPTLSIEKTLC
jgi:unsaturated rhamnogalacturonyl hydrolase